MLFHQVTQKLRNMNYVISNENQVAINTMVLFSTLYLQLDLKWDHLQIIPFLLLVLIICHSSYLYNVNKMDTVVYESLKPRAPLTKIIITVRIFYRDRKAVNCTLQLGHVAFGIALLNSEKFQNFGFLTEIVIFESKSQIK